MRESQERFAKENAQLREELAQQYASDQRSISEPVDQEMEVSRRAPPPPNTTGARLDANPPRGSVFDRLGGVGRESHANPNYRREGQATSGAEKNHPEQEKEAAPSGSAEYYKALLDKVIADVAELKDPHRNALTSYAGTVDSPFTATILAEPVPKHWKASSVGKYNGKIDSLISPDKHLRVFEAYMKTLLTSDRLMCRLFPETLTETAMLWFGKLEANSIRYFSDLANHFIQRFGPTSSRVSEVAELYSIK